MNKILVLAMLAASTGCATMPDQKGPVTLEFRPGSQSPGPGLSAMTVVGSDRTVYVSEDVVLSNIDVASSSVVSGPHGPQIEIAMTKAGAKRFATATGNNVMKPLCILVDGQLIGAPIIGTRISGGRVVISGNMSEDEAKRIATGIARP